MKGKVKTLLNVRSTGSLDARILGVLPKGKELKIRSQKDGWGRITYDGQTGYVCMEYIELLDDKEKETKKEETRNGNDQKRKPGRGSEAGADVIEPMGL